MTRPTLPPRLKIAKGGNYRIHWFDETTRKPRTLSTNTNNHLAAAKIFDDWLNGDLAANNKNISVSRLLSLYRDEHIEHAHTHPLRAHGAIDRLIGHFGHLDYTAITQDHLLSYCAGLSLAPYTIERELKTLRSALKYGVKTGRIESFRSFVIRSTYKPRERTLTNPEIAQLKEAAAGRRVDGRITRPERLLWIGLETAARRRSIELLTWDRVNFETGMIDFNIPGKARTIKRQAIVPMSDRLRAFLTQAYAQSTNQWVMDNKKGSYDGFVTMAESAGIDNIYPHCLRHTRATQLIRAGVSFAKVAQYLGNSAATVMLNYSHLAPSDLTDIVNI